VTLVQNIAGHVKSTSRDDFEANGLIEMSDYGEFVLARWFVY